MSKISPVTLDLIPDAANTILVAAYSGELNLLKQFALELDEVLADGVTSILENAQNGRGKRAVHYAAIGGNVNVLKYLIEKIGVEIDVQDGKGYTPLTCAIMERNLASVDCLLKMGANSEIPDYSNCSPLHYAAIAGHKDIILLLLSRGINVDVTDEFGSPLAYAAFCGCHDAVKVLLNHGANPEIPDNINCTPLHHAARKGHKEIIPLLLSKGINVDVTNEFGSPLLYAIIQGYHDTVKVFLGHGANPNLMYQETVTPLCASVCLQSWQCAEELLKGGADPNGGSDGIKPLPIAAEKGVVQIIKILVEAGADPNITDIRGLKPIEAAAVTGSRQGVEILYSVTSPIPSYDDWCVNGIMEHVTSKEFELKALNMKPRDATVLSNRSLCYFFLYRGDLALEDATQCVLARPDWPEAFYRAGMALKMLNRLNDAAVTFSTGLKLDPENREFHRKLQDAFRDVCSHCI